MAFEISEAIVFEEGIRKYLLSSSLIKHVICLLSFKVVIESGISWCSWKPRTFREESMDMYAKIEIVISLSDCEGLTRRTQSSVNQESQSAESVWGDRCSFRSTSEDMRYFDSSRFLDSRLSMMAFWNCSSSLVSNDKRAGFEDNSEW